jgi:poly(A) polymerase
MVIDEKQNQALAIIERLRAASFTAYLAGGCVRDQILGVTPKDYDIATDALPAEVQKLFDHTVAVGARFGVIMVILGDHHFEVATFRADAEYLDGRHPSAVRFGTIEDDVQRRDFTIGGMYFDPATGRIIDLVGGVRDLRAGVVRAIGKVDERFKEDHLRMLRAVRFAARLGFEIEAAAWAAIRRSAPDIAQTSAERVGEEMVMIMTEGGAAQGVDLLIQSELAAVVMPELLALSSCPQPTNYHPEGDVYRHTKLMLSMLPRGCTETLAFGTLLHDIAKPRCFAVAADGKMTYYGHTDQGAEMAVEIMSRLRRSRMVQDLVAYLVRDHLRLTMAPRMRKATLKRMITEDGFDELMQLAMIDALASSSYLGFYHLCRQELAAMGAVETRPPRLIGGNDLIAMGFRPGPAFKKILSDVEDLQLEGALATRDEAIAFVRGNYQPASDAGSA